MSTPAQVITADTDSLASKAAANSTFEEKVNTAVSSAKQDENGNLILPDDLSEDILYAARAEKRRRDTQSALAKVSSVKSVLEVENEELRKLVLEGKRIELSPDDEEELNELMHSDPKAWREKMNALEQNATTTVTTKLSAISDAAKTKGSVGEREVLLQAFQDDNPGLVITDEVLANDIPPRITRALESGEISFMTFLGNVKSYLESGKAIDKGQKLADEPNLSTLAGSDVPGKNADEAQTETDYEKMIF